MSPAQSDQRHSLGCFSLWTAFCIAGTVVLLCLGCDLGSVTVVNGVAWAAGSLLILLANGVAAAGRAVLRPVEPVRPRDRVPLPPTTEETAAAARARYEATLRLLATAGLDEIELQAARLRAKQQYLRELDGLMH